jgi:hypothetical protein
MATRTTVRTIERGVRMGKSQSQTNLVVVRQRSSSSNHRSTSPTQQVKQQLVAFVDQSHAERDELNKLNNRMACFVSKAKQLEAHNVQLSKEIQDIQCHWGDATRAIREQYEQTLFDMRGRIDDVSSLKTIADVRNKRASYENDEFSKRCEDISKIGEADKNKIKNLERELCQLKESKEIFNKSFDEQVKDLEKYRLNRDEVWSNLVDLLDKLDEELFRRICTEYNNQTLREHIEFVKQVNEREIAEMNQLGEALPFNDQIEFYKDQLKRVISNIRKDYENLNLEQAKEMDEWMRQKTEELAEQAAKRDPIHDLEMTLQLENMEQLRDTYDLNNKELDDLKKQNDLMQKRLACIEEHLEKERVHNQETMERQNEEVHALNQNLEQLLNDYNHINANKATLEYEMQVYKRLLDSQLDKSACQPCQPVLVECTPCVPTVTTKLSIDTTNQTSTSNAAFGGKVQNKKEKKGSIGIANSSTEGKFIVIENAGSSASTVDLSGWIVKRKVDSNNDIYFKIPQGTVLPANKEIVVWASPYRQYVDPSTCYLLADLDNWGIGINSVTRLLTSSGEEKSSFYQQLSFSTSTTSSSAAY